MEQKENMNKSKGMIQECKSYNWLNNNIESIKNTLQEMKEQNEASLKLNRLMIETILLKDKNNKDELGILTETNKILYDLKIE